MVFDKLDWSHVLMQLQRFSPDDELERCGMIVYRPWQRYFSLFEMNNNHGDPVSNFAISWQQLTEFTEYFPELTRMGWLHTHPGRDREGWLPSDRDMQRANEDLHTLHTLYHPYSRTLAFYDFTGVYDYLRTRPMRRKNERGLKSTVAKRVARRDDGLGRGNPPW